MKSQKLFVFLFFLLSLTVSAQQPTATPPVADDKDLIKISTNLIQVDVTVTDKDGNVVTDLKPEDFEVYENGKKQTITNFSFISINKPPEKTSPQPTNRADKNAIPIPPVRLKAEQVRRTYALVVDDLGLNFGNVFWVKQSLKKFVNEQMREGDLVAVISTGIGFGSLQGFTSDKRQLLAAIEKIRWNPRGRAAINNFDPIKTTLSEDRTGTIKFDGTERTVLGTEAEKEFQSQTNDFRNESFAVGTLGALNYIIRGMRELSGRKAVILFSEGFVITAGNQPNRALDGLRILVDLANRSSVVFYTLDPRGLQVPGMANSEDEIRNILPSSFEPLDTSDLRTDREDKFRDSQQSLRYLAYETGGVPYVNQNDLNKGIQRAIDDQSSYYLLGYQPDEETFDPKKNKFNKLEVKLLRPDLKIRYRSGFFGITDEKIQNVPQTPQQKLMNALVSPFGATGIGLGVYPVFQNAAESGNMIQALVHIDANHLTFTKTPDGKQKAVFDIVAATFGDNGAVINSLSKIFTLEVSEQAYQNMLKNGFVYTLPVPVKKPGAYQFRIALRDTVSDKVGSASQFIEVPNINKKLALSNIVLDNFTPAEFQKIRSGGNRNESERSTLLDTTLRQYKRETILYFDYVIYNPNPNHQLESQLRLIKDGKIAYEENPSPVTTKGETDLTRLQKAGAITLGKNLEAGSYILQIIVSDKTNAKKFTTQYVEFEIVQ